MPAQQAILQDLLDGVGIIGFFRGQRLGSAFQGLEVIFTGTEEIIDRGTGGGAQQRFRHQLAIKMHHLFKRCMMVAIEVQKTLYERRRMADRAAQFIQIRA